MSLESYTCISLAKVRLMLRIGHFDWEHGQLSPVDISVDLYTTQSRWPAPTLKTIIDYNRVHAYLQGWADRPHRDFLEAYAEDLLAFCFTDSRVEACRVRLAKPDIYPDAAGAAVEIRRTRREHRAQA